MTEQTTRYIFLVTQGQYSDYHVVCAFSTREKAERFTAGYKIGPFSGSVHVEPYPLDEIPLEREGFRRFMVNLDKDGNADVKELPKEYDDPDHILWGSPGNQRIHVWARDEQHAAKIAGEHRAVALAMNQLQ